VKKILFLMCGFLVFNLGLNASQASAVYRFSLLAETMRPIDSTIGYNNYNAFLTTTQESSVNPATCYIGQVNLPHGEKILSVRCFGQDSDPNKEFSFGMYRYELYANPVYQAVSSYVGSGIAFSGGKIDFAASIISTMATVDNEKYSYGIYLTLPKAQTGSLGVLRFVIETTSTQRVAVVPLF
jgi:hypothetical protein